MLAAGAWKRIPLFWQGAGLPRRGLPVRDRVPSLALRSLAAKQLWGRAPLSRTSYLLDKNPLNTPESHAVTPPVFGTRSPKFAISQQERNGLRRAARYWVMGGGRTAGVGSRWTRWSIFEHGNCFMGLFCSCGAVLPNIGLYFSLASSLKDDRAEDTYRHPRQGLLCGGWYLYTPIACLGNLQHPG